MIVRCVSRTIAMLVSDDSIDGTKAASAAQLGTRVAQSGFRDSLREDDGHAVGVVSMGVGRDRQALSCASSHSNRIDFVLEVVLSAHLMHHPVGLIETFDDLPDRPRVRIGVGPFSGLGDLYYVRL